MFLITEKYANAEEPGGHASNSSFCYQKLCLKDSIRKLPYTVSSFKHTAPSGKFDPETLKQAEKLLIGGKPEIELLARQGIVDKGVFLISQETLNALKNIKTICGKVADFVSVKVIANNGKEILLFYTPMTAEDGTSSYSLTTIRAPYPEVQSSSEQEELVAQAAKVMNMEFECNQLGTGLSCDDKSHDNELNIENGMLTITISRGKTYDHYFSLDKARQHPSCGIRIKF